MITRDLSDLGYKAGCENAPPPLHVHDTQSAAASWYPLPRPYLAPHHPGPVLVKIGTGLAATGGVGDDPTDPSAQTVRRQPTAGMIARLNLAGHP